MPFKPKIHEVKVEDAGEVFQFFVKEPSGREVLREADKLKKNPDRAGIENARSLFSNYMVKDEAGTPLSEQEVEEVLDMRLTAMNKVTEVITETIGLKRALEKNA